MNSAEVAALEGARIRLACIQYAGYVKNLILYTMLSLEKIT